MVLFLNYLPYLIILVGLGLVFLAHKKYAANPTEAAQQRYSNQVIWVTIATIALLIILSGLTAGYIPKAGVMRIAPPDYSEEPTEPRKVEDRLRKPKYDADESKKRFDDMVDWRKKREPEQDVK